MEKESCLLRTSVFPVKICDNVICCNLKLRGDIGGSREWKRHKTVSKQTVQGRALGLGAGRLLKGIVDMELDRTQEASVQRSLGFNQFWDFAGKNSIGKE